MTPTTLPGSGHRVPPVNGPSPLVRRWATQTGITAIHGGNGNDTINISPTAKNRFQTRITGMGCSGIRLVAGRCAHCGARDTSWKTVPDPDVMPARELMYECQVCRKTTREGRYATGSSGDQRAGFGGSRNTRSSN